MTVKFIGSLLFDFIEINSLDFYAEYSLLNPYRQTFGE